VRPLVGASLLLLVLLVGHDLDHAFNQPSRDLDAAVSAVGIVGLVSAGVMLALALARRPEAGLAAVAVGFGTVLGLVAVHLVPEWGAASDPYPDLDLNALSWLLVALPMAAAAWLGALGLRKLRAGPLPN